jgi:hypothetical protein
VAVAGEGLEVAELADVHGLGSRERRSGIISQQDLSILIFMLHRSIAESTMPS